MKKKSTIVLLAKKKEKVMHEIRHWSIGLFVYIQERFRKLRKGMRPKSIRLQIITLASHY